MKSSKDFFWPRIFLVLLIFPALFWGAYFFGTHFLKFEVQIPPGLFLKSAESDCRPEGLEHFLYFAAVIFPPVLFLLSQGLPFSWLNGLDGVLQRSSKFFSKTRTRTVVLMLGVALLTLAVMVPYSRPIQLRQVATAFVILILFLQTPSSLLGQTLETLKNRLSALPVLNPIVHGLALLLIGIELLPSFQNDATLEHSVDLISVHFPYIYGEFAAVLNGKTPWVDFFPQYMNLLPYLTTPYFRLFGLSVGSFTLLMIGFSFVSLGTIYWLFGRLTRSWVSAFLLLIPFLGFSFAPVRFDTASVANNFTYYPNGPLRYLVPYFAFYFLWNFLNHPGRKTRISLLILSTFALLNNLDFGAACWAAMIATLALLEKNRLTLAWEAGAVFVAELLAWMGWSWIRAGSPLNPLKLGMFQKIFGYYGFFMLPIPRLGLHWISFLIVMTALLVGLFDAFKTRPNRIMSGLLIYSSVFGLGAGMYFVGRSHPEVLHSLYSIITLCLILLGIRSFQLFQETGAFFVTGRLLFLSLIFLSPKIFETSHPFEQIRRIRHPEITPLSGQREVFLSQREKLAQVILQNSKKGAQVEIIYPFGFELAERAGVKNQFPFVQAGSMAIIGQVDQAMAALPRFDIHEVYGNPQQEMAMRLVEAGFNQVASVDGFGVWRR